MNIHTIIDINHKERMGRRISIVKELPQRLWYREDYNIKRWPKVNSNFTFEHHQRPHQRHTRPFPAADVLLTFHRSTYDSDHLACLRVKVTNHQGNRSAEMRYILAM